MDVDSENNEPTSKKAKFSNLANESCNVTCKEKNIEEQLQTTRTVHKIECTNEIHSEQLEPQEKIDSDDTEHEEKSSFDEEDDEFTFPPDDAITDMLEGVEYHGSFPTITDRYFTPFYKLNVQGPADDICVLIHSNRICMLTLAPSHKIFQGNSKITKIDFKVSEKLDRTLNKVSGKGKHGAQPLQANSNICLISCSNGETHTIKCCIIGKLVEVNEDLLENPELLLQPPHRGGYLAIILPNIKLLERMKKSLLSQEQYEVSISERERTKNDSELSKLKENSEESNAKEDFSITSKNLKTETTSLLKSNNDQIAFTVAS